MKYILCILSFLFACSSFSQTIVWQNNAGLLNAGTCVEVLEDKTGTLSFEQVSSAAYNDKFKQSEDVVISFGYTESYHWLRFSLQNYTNNKLVLEIANAFLPETELYYTDRNGRLVRLQGGYKTPFNEKMIKSHFQLFRLPNGNSQIYVRLLSNTHPFPVKIWEEDKYSVISQQRKIVYGLYLGLMIFVILNQLFNVILLRSGLHLLYVLVVFMYICYTTLVLDGFAVYFIDELDLMFWHQVVPAIGVIVQMVYCLFFLEVAHYTPKLKKAALGIIAYFVVYSLIRPLLPLTTILTINTVNALISFFAMGFIGIKVGRAGNRMGYYFAAAYFIYFCLVVVQAVYIQTGHPSYLIISHVAIATIIEVLILSFLLLQKGKWTNIKIQKEKDSAQQNLIESIKYNEEILAEQNMVLEKEVRLRTKTLEDVNDELKKAVAAKDKFFMIIAHDIKGPLNSVLNFSDLLIEDDTIDMQERRELFFLMNKQLKKTYTFIEDLLSWSRAQSKNSDFEIKELDFVVVANEIKELLQHTANAKNIQINNNITAKVLVMADYNILHTVLRNFVNNAIKFTPENGSISINYIMSDMQKELKYHTFCVQDNGVGIPPERANNLFNITKKISTRGTNNESGSGLGLMLCKEFIEIHGGKTWVKSEVGKGSCFYFSIPAERTTLS